MKRLDVSASPRWLWPIQIAVGAGCIGLSILIAFSPSLGTYTFLLLAGAGLLILGAERVAAGIHSRQSRRSSRIINIIIGAGIITWIGSGFFFPAIAIKYLVLFLGFGLLANGALRIFDGLKKKKEEPLSISSVGAGIISAAVAVAVLAYPSFGFVLVLIMTVIALAVSGIQVIIAGIIGARRRGDSLYSSQTVIPEYERRMTSTGKGIWKNGSWFRDDQGRYLLFRGVNFASRSKLPPYLPIAPLETKNMSQLDLSKEIESVKTELDLLKDLGFNVVRFLISWKAIEPRPNPNLAELLPEGKEYLSHVQKIIDELYVRNIYVILDFHQDIAQEAYGGDGFPDWALAIDKEHERPEASDFKDKKWLIKYAINGSVKQTLRSFWRNDLTNMEENGIENFPVRTHLEKTIGQAVRFFRSINNGQGHPAILGIEPFNEPHPVGLPKEQFEGELLVDYYRNVNSELASYDPDAFIFIEPRVDWTVSKGEGDDKSSHGHSAFSAKNAFNMGLVRNLMVEGKVDSRKIHTYLPKNLSAISNFDRNGVLSFHYYDTMAVASSFLKIPESMYTYRREWSSIFDQLVQAATDRGLVPFLTEFGGYQGAEQIRDFMNLLFEQVEAHLLNSTYWNYDMYHTNEGKDNWNLEDYSLLGPDRTPRNIDVVARPYPMRSSAEPVFMSFSIDTKWATIIMKGAAVAAPTIIYIPFMIHYAPEFTVWTTGGHVKWDRENQLLYWFQLKGSETNQIIIGKGKKLDIKELPEPARNITSRITLRGSFT